MTAEPVVDDVVRAAAQHVCDAWRIAARTNENWYLDLAVGTLYAALHPPDDDILPVSERLSSVDVAAIAKATAAPTYREVVPVFDDDILPGRTTR